MSEPFTVREPTGEDVRHVARNLRPSDLFDVRAVTRMDPVTAVMKTYAHADRRYGFFEGTECFAIAGIEWTDQPGEASAWLLGTPVLDRLLARGGLSASRRQAEVLLQDVSSAFNFVPSSNRVTLKWLRWLGFRTVRKISDFRGLGVECVEVRRDIRAA